MDARIPPDMGDEGTTAKVLAQNVHTLAELPEKLQRLWEEEWGESADDELFLVVCAANGDMFVFGERGRAFGLQAAESSRWFTKIEYEIIDSSDEPDENNEIKATFNLVLNDPITDSREESWVESVAAALAALAREGPHKEDQWEPSKS
jgi:hypothetical protein